MSGPIAELLDRAAGGDDTAWRSIVDRYQPMIWRIAGAHGLCTADAADVSQFCWLTLADNLRALRDPERLGSWLATTARRESLRIAKARSRETACDEWEAGATPEPGPDRLALLCERDRALWSAVAELPQRCRVLLTLIAVAPELSYVQLARAVGISLGSVGPNRGRCLAQLRRQLARSGFFEEVS